MGRTTVTLDEEAETIVDKKVGDSGGYESVSSFVRESVKQYERADGLRNQITDLEEELEGSREQRDQLQERANRVDNLEQEVDRLKNEKRLILAERKEKAELARYVENERRFEQRWREAGLLSKTKWRLFGMPSEDSTA